MYALSVVIFLLFFLRDRLNFKRLKDDIMNEQIERNKSTFNFMLSHNVDSTWLLTINVWIAGGLVVQLNLGVYIMQKKVI
jgi:hypothetical protein